jgi:hypothetical protein
MEKLVDPNNKSKVIGYSNCYFTKLGYQYASDGDMVVMMDAEIIYGERYYISKDRR